MDDAERTEGGPQSVEDFHKQRFQENLAHARKRLDELEADPSESCSSCGHIPYPIVAVQHCWCDPAEDEPCTSMKES